MTAIRSLLILLLMLAVPSFWGCDQGANGQSGLTSTNNGGEAESGDDDGEEDDGDCDEDDWGDDDDDDDFEIPAECEPALDAADACWDALDEEAEEEAIDACEELEDLLWECVDDALPE